MRRLRSLCHPFGCRVDNLGWTVNVYPDPPM